MLAITKLLEDTEWILKSDFPRLEALVREIGYEWMTELLLEDNPKSDGTSGGITFEIALEEIDTDQLSSSQKPDLPDERGLEFFLVDVDFLYEDAADGGDAGWDTFREVLDQWISQRITYLRTFQSLNATQARLRAYEETQRVALGGDELACIVCGSLFWDNLERLKDAERHYCSVECQEGVEADCLNCGTHFQVGRAKRGFRNYFKLNGFCDYDCYTSDWAKRTEDNRYVQGVRRRLEILGSDAEVDETVTRRAVFERDKGKCYLCGTQTHWHMEGEWDPLLASLDHIKPVSRGGDHSWENVAIACMLCNIRKGAKDEVT